jgi:hypothetical protein
MSPSGTPSSVKPSWFWLNPRRLMRVDHSYAPNASDDWKFGDRLQRRRAGRQAFEVAGGDGLDLTALTEAEHDDVAACLIGAGLISAGLIVGRWNGRPLNGGRSVGGRRNGGGGLHRHVLRGSDLREQRRRRDAREHQKLGDHRYSPLNGICFPVSGAMFPSGDRVVTHP